MTFLLCFKNIFEGEFATQTCLQGKFGEEMGSDQFGGCIMFHSPVPSADLVTGRIEYVEVSGSVIMSEQSTQSCPYNEWGNSCYYSKCYL